MAPLERQASDGVRRGRHQLPLWSERLPTATTAILRPLEPLRTTAIQCILRYGASMTTRHALVTGGCSGIGLEIARELAGRGYPLLLVSNRDAELEAAAREIAAAYGVGRLPHQDGSGPSEAARALYEDVTSRGLEVPNPCQQTRGCSSSGVADADPPGGDHDAAPRGHALAAGSLFGQDMRARRSGHILFTSSISAWRDFPGIAYYAAPRPFCAVFACALREELSVWGATSPVSHPGEWPPTSTTGRCPGQKAVKYGVMKDLPR